MKPLRLGIVGVGRHGSRYAQHAARDVEGIELVAVCRRDVSAGRALAAELGCDFMADARELIRRPDVDAVALVTVPDLLEGLIDEAVSAGKRLLVEKPVAPDLVTGRRILARLQAAGSYCLAGHTLRFNNVCRAMRQAVPELGRVGSLVFSQSFPPQPQLAWLDDPRRAGGGNILHTGVHCFDLVRYLTGYEPEAVTCITRRIHTARTEDSFACSMTMRDSSALATVSCARTSGARDGLIGIIGEHGQLLGDHVDNSLCRITAQGRLALALPAAARTVLEILGQLAADARDDSAPAISYEDGLIAVAVADACYRAAASGRLERVAAIG